MADRHISLLCRGGKARGNFQISTISPLPLGWPFGKISFHGAPFLPFSNPRQLRAKDQQLEARHMQREQEWRYREEQERNPAFKEGKRERQAQGTQKVPPNPRASRSRRSKTYGLLAAFLLLPAMKEDKTQSKQAKDQGIFFWFGDELAVDHNPH